MDTKEQIEKLEELVKNSKKELFYERIRTAAVLITAVVVIIALAVMVPSVMHAVENANQIMTQASEAIVLADEAIVSVTEMSDSITSMGDDMDVFIKENSSTMEEAMKNIESIDFQGLNKAIKDLGDVVAPLASFFNKFGR